MRIAPILVGLALLAGCGEDDEPPAAAAGEFANLEVTVDGKSATVQCDSADDSPECGTVAELDAKVFEPTPGDTACTQQFGGPEKATVTGTLRGDQVDARFSRENGCEIARWQDASELLALAQ